MPSYNLKIEILIITTIKTRPLTMIKSEEHLTGIVRVKNLQSWEKRELTKNISQNGNWNFIRPNSKNLTWPEELQEYE